MTDSVSPVRAPQPIFFSSKIDPDRSEPTPILPIPPSADFQNLTAAQGPNSGSTVSTQQGVALSSALPAGTQPALVPAGSLGSTISTVSSNSTNGVSTVSIASGVPPSAGASVLDSTVSTVTPSMQVGSSNSAGLSSLKGGKEGMGDDAAMRNDLFPSAASGSKSNCSNGSNGSNGSSGPNGPSGANGANGSNGSNGSNSATGTTAGATAANAGGGEKGEESKEWKELMGNVGEGKAIDRRWTRSSSRVS